MYVDMQFKIYETTEHNFLFRNELIWFHNNLNDIFSSEIVISCIVAQHIKLQFSDKSYIAF